MENLPLLSVIVPVYKVEAYLDKCISSIVNQSYKNLEIILVDDGSPDRSGAICDKWAAKDSRIRVIHQENQGGGAARNAALDAANGELLAFADSDDYLASDMYAHLYGLLERGADIAECGYVEVTDDDAAFSQDGEVWVCSAQEAMAAHVQDRFFRQLIWNKLYRREVVGDIRFPVGKKIDDEFFTYRVLGNAKTLSRSNRLCYAYRQQPDSVMHVPSAQKCIEAVEAKAQRHAFILQKFPTLSALSLASLYGAALYQGQLALRRYDEPKAILRQIETLLSAQSGKPRGDGIKQRLWLWGASHDLERTARIRNALGIGL